MKIIRLTSKLNLSVLTFQTFFLCFLSGMKRLSLSDITSFDRTIYQVGGFFRQAKLLLLTVLLLCSILKQLLQLFFETSHFFKKNNVKSVPNILACLLFPCHILRDQITQHFFHSTVQLFLHPDHFGINDFMITSSFQRIQSLT